MKKVLVPTDFSDNSKQALRIAAGIATKNNANVEILHVNTAAVYTPIMPEVYSAQIAELENYEVAAAENLKLLKDEVFIASGFEGLVTETRVEGGNLHSTVSKMAQEDGCDLVVMGTQGASNATEFFIGSNTERVIRTATCPVLAIPQGTTTFEPKTVVLPTTLRDDQAPAFKALAEWQHAYGFKVKVLYLNNPAGFETDTQMQGAANHFCHTTGLTDFEVFTSNDTFNEEQTILNFAEQANADLIAMGTHQRRGISHMLFGSIAEDTANHSTLPVLCIPLN